MMLLRPSPELTLALDNTESAMYTCFSEEFGKGTVVSSQVRIFGKRIRCWFR